MNVAIVIPARFASTRLPGKPLIDILGKPMIQHVYERASQVSAATSVIVATDDQRILDEVAKFGGRAEMTSPQHQSGTDRLIELLSKVDADLFVNIQGDEPLIRPDDIALLIEGMNADKNVLVGTLCHDIDSEEALDPNIVKVVLAEDRDALYFSRSRVPYVRDEGVDGLSYLKHVGVYAYRREALTRFGSLKPSDLEASEKLEQLRFLSAGIRVRVFQVPPTGPGVDTPESLEQVRSIMSGQQIAGTQSYVDRLKQIKLVITDVDGVLTDGSIFYSENGEVLKCFHVRDGLGMKMLEELGVRVAVLSGKDSPALRRRIADLGISAGMFGIKDKSAAVKELQNQFGVSEIETACIGDDSIDIPAFNSVGLSFAVSDATDYIKKIVDVVLQKEGGKGAFREVADAILQAKGHGAVLGSADGYGKIMNQMVQ